MEITIDDVKQFAILHDDLPQAEETFIMDTLLPTAREYVESAGVVGKVAETFRAKLVTLMIVTHWYEHRESFAKGYGVKGALEMPYHINHLLLQLQYGDTSPVEVVDDPIIDEVIVPIDPTDETGGTP